ncbi:MAG: NUDIX hydrolase [Akkermansia sp.]|nr:NUDIX hydrolase [Akkermansia sp.]
METLYKGKFLNMVCAGRWEYCERVNNTAAAMIFACTAEGKVLLVEEYRPPIAAQSICFPAGLIGDIEPEDGVVAAGRELLEETGYEASAMRYLFTGPSSPGLTSEVISFYLADGLVRKTNGGGVEGENITVHEVPLSDIDAWLTEQMAAGKSIDPRVYTGLYFLKQHA